MATDIEGSYVLTNQVEVVEVPYTIICLVGGNGGLLWLQYCRCKMYIWPMDGAQELWQLLLDISRSFSTGSSLGRGNSEERN